jgi:hypothetical protein
LYADAKAVVDDEQRDSPAAYRKCSSLVESLRSIENLEDAGALNQPTEDEIYSHYLGEIDVQPGESNHRVKRFKKQKPSPSP